MGVVRERGRACEPAWRSGAAMPAWEATMKRGWRRKTRREGFCGASVGVAKNLAQSCTALQLDMSTIAPVVEIPRHQQRRIGRHIVPYQIAHQFDLMFAVRLA